MSQLSPLELIAKNYSNNLSKSNKKPEPVLPSKTVAPNQVPPQSPPVDLVLCMKCLHRAPPSEMYGVHYKGQLSYECVDEKQCYNRKNAERIEKNNKAEELRKQYAHLPQEEQFKAMYGIDFDDLIEDPRRTRDASIHYNHKDTNERFSWSWATKNWYQ